MANIGMIEPARFPRRPAHLAPPPLLGESASISRSNPDYVRHRRASLAVPPAHLLWPGLQPSSKCRIRSVASRIRGRRFRRPDSTVANQSAPHLSLRHNHLSAYGLSIAVAAIMLPFQIKRQPILGVLMVLGIMSYQSFFISINFAAPAFARRILFIYTVMGPPPAIRLRSGSDSDLDRTAPACQQI